MQLASPARVHLAVHAHLALGDELARLRAGLGEPGELEELAEADDVVGDLDRAGVVGGVHDAILPGAACRDDTTPDENAPRRAAAGTTGGRNALVADLPGS
ncbi:Uncharacterised protein [Mycobacteroides abscessus]|nr:Uncharacterised protein [Mycobacteroides abscessus]